MSKKNMILSHLTGLVCAVGLSVLVSVICEYNFLLMLLLFTALYVVIGVLAEYLRGILSVERKIVSKSAESECLNDGQAVLPNKEKAAKIAKALKKKAENTSK